jgi:hypothetical protein
MHYIKILLLLVCLTYLSPVFGQTDTAVVKVDSAFLAPGRKVTPRDSTKKDTVRLINGPALKDTSKVKKKEVVKDSARVALEKMPRRAVLASAIVPGLGQIYNKRWWKVPLVYGGFVGIYLVYDFNQRYYKDFLAEAQYRQLNDGKPNNPKYAQYDQTAIVNAKDFYRRNRDLSILAGLAFHAIQVIDAYVDAKFFRYDISDELAIKVAPTIQSPSIYNAYTPIPSIKLKLSL